MSLCATPEHASAEVTASFSMTRIAKRVGNSVVKAWKSIKRAMGGSSSSSTDGLKRNLHRAFAAVKESEVQSLQDKDVEILQLKEKMFGMQQEINIMGKELTQSQNDVKVVKHYCQMQHSKKGFDGKTMSLVDLRTKPLGEVIVKILPHCSELRGYGSSFKAEKLMELLQDTIFLEGVSAVFVLSIILFVSQCFHFITFDFCSIRNRRASV